MADHYESPVMNSLVARGEAQGEHRQALRLLTWRFKNPLTDDQLARLEQADSEQLLEVLLLIYDPQLSLEEVLERGLTRPSEPETDDGPHTSGTNGRQSPAETASFAGSGDSSIVLKLT